MAVAATSAAAAAGGRRATAAAGTPLWWPRHSGPGTMATVALPQRLLPLPSPEVAGAAALGRASTPSSRRLSAPVWQRGLQDPWPRGTSLGVRLGLTGVLAIAASRARPRGVAASAAAIRAWMRGQAASGGSSASGSRVPLAPRGCRAASATALAAARARTVVLEPPAKSGDAARLPPMSADGGSQEEFEEYWACNSSPRRLAGGWLERRAHPQVNIEPFWYNETTSALTWERPDVAEEGKAKKAAVSKDAGFAELTGEGPEWEMGIQDLKQALAFGRGENLGLRTEELAKRAVAEYERFEPRVLSWHDYQHITFWFFGGLHRKQRGAGGKSFFDGQGGQDLFANRAFFNAAADVMMERVDRMHPINLTYFIWTFTRAGVVRRDLMETVGDYLLGGLLPTMDRCSLGTMVWNFTKQRINHDALFEGAARELCRPNRTRSLAARNFQNVMIAYARRNFWHEELYDALAHGIPRLIDNHDPRHSKNARHVLFSYTCKDGYEVLADSFRIGNLTVILKEFLKVPVKGPAIEGCVVSMADYVRRSEKASPKMMREQGDVADFLITLARAAAAGRWGAAKLLGQGGPFEMERLVREMSSDKADLLRRTMRRADIDLRF